MAYEHLLRPGSIGPIKLKNRIMWASHGANLGEENGEISEAHIDYYARRARGGVGLIVSELVLAATEVDALKIAHTPMRADDARFVPKLARLAKAVHDNGAKIGVQMSPGAGVQAMGGPWSGDPGVRAVSPSGVLALGFHEHAMNPRVLKTEEIKRIVELFGAAAANVREAGFDLIEVHAHGGYLIHQFLSPYFNKRTDEYGGSLDNRCRFLLEIVDSVKKVAGAEIAVTVKWSVEDFLPGGWDTAQSLELVKWLEAAGVDALGVSSGVHGGKLPAAPPYFYPMGAFLPFAEPVRRASKISLYSSGRLDDPDFAERVLKEDRIDFIQICRGLIADPDWVKKIAQGQAKEIRPCLACNHCRHQLVNGRALRCSVNAAAGRERELDAITSANTRRKVLVVGGGPAGMEAARVAALRGHQVTLCEKYGRLGGLTLVAGVHNELIAKFSRWLVAQVGRLPVEVRLNTEATPELVAKLRPDVVIVATGGRFVKLDIPGIDKRNVHSASELLQLMRGEPASKAGLIGALSPFASRIASTALVRRVLGMNYPIGNRVAVIGGQFAGCSLALLLAHKGKSVTMIEESGQYGTDLEANTLVGLNNEVAAGRVQVLTSAKACEVTERGVVVQNGEGDKRLVEATSVFVALEMVPHPGKWTEQLGDQMEVHVIGDANAFERLPHAVAEGYITAQKL